MAGKNIILILFILVCLALDYSLSAPAKSIPDSQIFIKGGLIFEKGSEQQVTINPPSVLFSKFVDFKLLDQAALLSQKFTDTYATFCNKLHGDLYSNLNINKEKRFFVSEKAVLAYSARGYCDVREGRLPEIRSADDYQTIIHMAQRHGIRNIPAGIWIDEKKNKWLYSSDSVSVSENRHLFDGAYSYPVTEDRKRNFEKDAIVTNQAISGQIVYYRVNDEMRIQVYDSKTNIMEQIICQQNDSPKFEALEQTLLLKMTAHNCRRDLDSIVGTTKLVTSETQRFSKVNIAGEEPDVNIQQDQHLSNVKAEKLTDYLENLSKNITVCMIYTTNSSCLPFYEYLTILNDISYKIAVNSNLQTPFVVLYIVFSLLKQLRILKNFETFEGCRSNTNIFRLKRHLFNDQIHRLISYSVLMNDKCGSWSSDEFLTKAIKRLESETNARKLNEAYYKFYTIALQNSMNTSESREIARVWNSHEKETTPTKKPEKVHLRANRTKRFLPLPFALFRNESHELLFKVIASSLPILRYHHEVLTNIKTKQDELLMQRLFEIVEMSRLDIMGKWEMFSWLAEFFSLRDMLKNSRITSILHHNDVRMELSDNSIVPVNDTNSLTGSESFTIHERRKRSLIATGIIGGLIGAGSSVSSLSTGESIFGWLGNTFGNSIGLATTNELRQVWKAVELTSDYLGNMTINQVELESAYNTLGTEVSRIENETKNLEYSTATLLNEMDTKLNLKHIQTTIQLTLLKIANALSFAQNNKASPYVFSQQELKFISTVYRQKKIQLSDSIADVFTTVYYDGAEALFTFRIPILEDKYYFTLYETKPIPIFVDNRVLIAQSDAQFFAYASANNEYSLLTRSEYAECKRDKYCVVEDVLRPVTRDSHCAIKTLNSVGNEPTCPPKQIERNEPYFGLKGHTLLYSVKNETDLTIICKDRATGTHDRQSKTIRGVGMSRVPPDCQIDFGNGMRAFSNPQTEVENMGSVSFMDILQYLPKHDQFSVHIQKQNVTDFFVPLNLQRLNYSSYRSILEEVINPQSAVPEIIRVLIAIAIFIGCGLLICFCSRKAGLCFKTWILWKNPITWLKTQGIKPGTLEKVEKIPIEKAIIKPKSLKRKRRLESLPFVKTQKRRTKSESDSQNGHNDMAEIYKEFCEKIGKVQEFKDQVNVQKEVLLKNPDDKEKDLDKTLTNSDVEKDTPKVVNKPNFATMSDEEFMTRFHNNEMALKPKEDKFMEMVYPTLSFRPINEMRLNNARTSTPVNNDNLAPVHQPNIGLQIPRPPNYERPLHPNETYDDENDTIVIDQPYAYYLPPKK